MENQTCQDNRPLQEWAPLNTLLEKIPATIQIGFFTQDVNFTCVDVIAEFIAVGTNHGVVYWFNRETEEIQKLGCQNTNSSITCIRVVSTVDYMVAAGNNQGVVTIFQAPKELPDSIPKIWKHTEKKQVNRFNISGLHKVSITAVEWSKNGMKLFSGDQNGLVVVTEMDFDMHLSKSTELLNEKYSVIQLSYQNGLLLISTLFRTIIVDRNNYNKIIQIGQTERKMFGKFGAVFIKNQNHVQGPIIYASRPGLRIWQADKQGTILKTLILKEAISIAQTQVKLLNPASYNSKKKNPENLTFGILMQFSDDLLITYNRDVIYFINPNTNTIKSVITNLRKVTDIACFKDEIFILEGERNILRIAYYPEETTFSKGESSTDHVLFANSNNPVTLGYIGLKINMKLNPIIPFFPFHKIKPKNIIQAISILPSVVIGIDTSSITNVDEAIEVTPTVPIKLDDHSVAKIDLISNQKENCIKRRIFNDRTDIFEKIGDQEFEEIVFTSKRKGNRTTNETKSVKNIQMKIVSIYNTEKQLNNHEYKINKTFIKSKNSSQVIETIERTAILESKYNLECIQKSIQDKENLLFNYLNLDLSKYINKSQICNIKYNSISLNDYRKDRTNCEVLVSESAKQNAEQHKNRLIDFEDLSNYSKNSKRYVTTKEKVYNKSDLKNSKISEVQFNDLSKEFVKSIICEDNDEWILLG